MVRSSEQALLKYLSIIFLSTMMYILLCIFLAFMCLGCSGGSLHNLQTYSVETSKALASSETVSIFFIGSLYRTYH